MLTEDNVARYAKALLPAAAMLFLVPLVSVGFQAYSSEAGSLQWRFATVGLFFGNLGTLVLGLGLAGLFAALSGNRGLLRGVGYLAFVLALVCLALLGLFALDALQIRRLVVLALRRQVSTSAASAATSALLAAFAFAAMGRGALLASRAARAVPAGRGKAPSPLVAQAAPPPRAAAAGEPV